MEENAETESAVPLSLVDGLSCALAAVLLLFLIFSVTVMSARVAVERGRSASASLHGQISGAEPTDIEVRFTPAIPAAAKVGWAAPDPMNDKVFTEQAKQHNAKLGAAQLTAGLVRRLSVGQKISEHWLPTSLVGLDVTYPMPADSDTRPRGTIRIHRATATMLIEFDCPAGRQSYRIISRIDRRSLQPTGDC